MYSFDIVTGELTEVINWINSDMNFNKISNLTVLPDGRFIVAENSGNYNGISLVQLSKKSEADTKGKYLLTFASVYMDTNLQDAVIKFNKLNDDYRIQYLDYSKYNTAEDCNAGIKKLNNDIISGQIPDMFSMTNLAYGTFASKGLLKDLGELMAADPEFDKSLYLENVLNASAFNGKLFSVIPSFSVMTVAGKKENVGSKLSWTMENLEALIQKYPEAAVFAGSSKTSMLTNFGLIAMGSYIDEETGVCSFNSASFYQGS